MSAILGWVSRDGVGTQAGVVRAQDSVTGPWNDADRPTASNANNLVLRRSGCRNERCEIFNPLNARSTERIDDMLAGRYEQLSCRVFGSARPGTQRSDGRADLVEDLAEAFFRNMVEQFVLVAVHTGRLAEHWQRQSNLRTTARP